MMLEDGFGSATVRFRTIELVPPQISRVSITQSLRVSIEKIKTFSIFSFFLVRIEHKFQIFFQLNIKKFLPFFFLLLMPSSCSVALLLLPLPLTDLADCLWYVHGNEWTWSPKVILFLLIWKEEKIQFEFKVRIFFGGWGKK